ncbi:MAG: hypothetical protein OEY49_15580, partial [Candidatus Heimdallarchaeota archaeon]|nr:hypothetical protein [Candidatus Heimdallarchaeota archaeon]
MSENQNNIPKLQSIGLVKSFKDYTLKEMRFIYRGLYYCFSNPLNILRYVFWAKSVDKGVKPDADWFEYKPIKPTNKGILLCHGFSSTPQELKPIAMKLLEQGYHVRAIRLAGHGTTPAHMAQTTGSDWFASVIWHYQELRKQCNQ